MASKEYISALEKNKNRITITPGESLKPYLNGDFFVEYDSPFDLSNIGDEVACIPFVLSTAAIVWCSGETLHLDKLDANLAEMITEYNCGCVIDRNNFDETLEKLIYFKSNLQELKKQGENAHKLAVEKFDRTKLALKLENLFLEIYDREN